MQDAIDRTDADLLIVHDADVWCDGLPEVVERIGDAPAAIPHSKVIRLSERGTAELMAGERWPHAAEEHRGTPGGGILVIRRDVWEQVPLDPRFRGWGQEDRSWAIALTCLTGKIRRHSHPLIHLWHPPQPRQDRRNGSPESVALEARYEAAEHDPDGMAVIVAQAARELREARWRSSPPTTSKPASAAT